MSVLTITNENFDAEVLSSPVPVLLDFWAQWCGPCQMVSPVVDEIAETADGFKVGKINVDEQPALAHKFGIEAIPTLVVVSGGKAVNSSVGAVSKEQILEMLK
ncbi:MAG: thioredoxin [Porcipelethomonas sp.]